MQMGFFFDISRCTGCYSCEIACKQKNNLKPNAEANPESTGPRWRRVLELETGQYPEEQVSYVSLPCLHCGKPVCLEACPTKAINKSIETGIVTVDKTKCIGCRYCFWACPFGAPQFGDSGLMEKCDLCSDRVKEGKSPACVATCPTKAITFGSLEELEKLAREKASKKLIGATQPPFFLRY